MKQEWLDYLEIVENYAKDLKKYVHDLPDEVTAEDTGGGGSNPPPPPPPTPGHGG